MEVPMIDEKWWHDAVVYQIYPRSFKDSNGDGIGDIPGIIEKLDYLADLGVNVIWLCPVYTSPMVDNGYDISDYRDINPEFGTLGDMERLFAEAGKRGIKVLMDLVLNHSSDQHEWFKNAVKAVLAGDTQNPYRDYYYFRQGWGDGPPNNWRSYFGGSCWEPVGKSGYWYLHLFAKEQPDLNWENPRLRRELYDMIRWWIDKGAAGFRIDAICNIKKDPLFTDLPVDGPDGLASNLPSCLAYPGIEDFLGELRDEVFEPGKCFTVAEAAGVKPEKLESFIGKRGFFSTIFDFSYTDIDIEAGFSYNKRYYFTRRELRDRIFKSQLDLPQHGYGAPYLENHDQNRSPDKYLDTGEQTFEGKTLLSMLYFFLRGVPFIYQGQELGMTNYPWKNIHEFNDISAHDQYSRMLREGLSEKEALELAAYRSRDNARIPMPWDISANAGFSTGSPWLPVHPDYEILNAGSQQKQSWSVLNFYRQMIRLRKEHADLFMYGEFIPRFTENKNIFAYERSWKGEGSLVICNFCDQEQELDIPGGKLWLGNYRPAGEAIGGYCLLSPLEALLLEC
ncbi:alpha-amylase [Spirochaetia bacterium]|nr:alpha-amylase [Spirochaetia bacterium]